MAMVLVEEDGSDMWAIADDEGDNNVWDGPDEANLITPPVTYGVVPAVAGEPLQTRGTAAFGGRCHIRPRLDSSVVRWRPGAVSGPAARERLCGRSASVHQMNNRGGRASNTCERPFHGPTADVSVPRIVRDQILAGKIFLE